MDITILAVTVALLVALMVCCVLPMYADSAEDRGDGLTTVIIPKYVRTPPHRPRTWAFLTITAVAGLLFLGLHHPNLPALYSQAVSRAAVAITHNPATVNGYVDRLRPALAFFAMAYVVAIAMVVRADLGRRVAILFHGVLYLAMTILAQVLMIVVGISSGWLVAPFGIEATLVNLLIGGLMVMRLTFTTFVLPRSTAVRTVKRNRFWENALTTAALMGVISLLVVSYAFLSEQSNLTSEWQVFLPLYAVTLLFTLMFVPLWALWWTGRRPPKPGGVKPPVDIIIPAYNEEENIARLLRSIDVAAKRYGGPVRVVVSNDGSIDNTADIAAAVMAEFRHARGEILTAPNGGQAAALNRGIAVTTAEIIVRVDADCVLGEDTLYYSVPWFADPAIGCVGAMEEPRTDTVTWFHRLRALECAFQFRFARLGQSLVDGIVVIPGTFTAFRREPAELCGGFPTGMNGEDADLTMQIGRLGYRVVVDPRIRSYEDVPRTPGEFVEQRTRWARAGFHVFARHMPLRAGFAGPRVWFWSLRRGFAWFSIQAGMVAPIFLLELALTHPSYRQNVVTFGLLYIAGGGVSLAVSLPYAIKYRWWRAILWSPTWFVYAFLRRLATLEAAISLPCRPSPFAVPVRSLSPARPGTRQGQAAPVHAVTHR
ncbi:MAG TPA: glycosyltransferase [Streptosporangiaceae bacterium]|nr:glycosyltransferase [Streptosporangiaceae bacterium]